MTVDWWLEIACDLTGSRTHDFSHIAELPIHTVGLCQFPPAEWDTSSNLFVTLSELWRDIPVHVNRPNNGPSLSHQILQLRQKKKKKKEKTFMARPGLEPRTTRIPWGHSVTEPHSRPEISEAPLYLAFVLMQINVDVVYAPLVTINIVRDKKYWTYLSRSITKPTNWLVIPATCRTAWSESSLSAWRNICQ